MKEFEFRTFDLQLFSEGEGEGADAGGQEDVEDIDIDPVDDMGEDNEPSGDPLALPNKLGLNKDGQLEYIEGEDDEEEDGGEGAQSGEKGKQETIPEAQAGGEQKPSFYSPEELFSLASANPAALDPARIPPESLPLYRALVANQVKQPAKEPEQKTDKQLPLEQLPPEEMAKLVTEAAMKVVIKELEAKGETFDEMDMSHQRMLFRAEAKIERDIETTVAKNTAQAEARKKVYSQFEVKAKEYQEKDGADFTGIDKLAETHMHTLPYAKAAPIAAAVERLTSGQLTEADIPILEGYWEDCRREYFAKKTGVTREPKQVPPQTLKPGNDKETKGRFDPKEIGKMDQDSRIEYYKRTGLADKLANLG